MGGKGLGDLSLFMGEGVGEILRVISWGTGPRRISRREQRGIKISIEFIKLPILTTYSNFEGCVKIKIKNPLPLHEFVAPFPNLMTRTSQEHVSTFTWYSNIGQCIA